ncbi:MAG TPA: PorP/SprF family type IX secretion system membrane protein [Ohtaekwangia sp.]
MISIRIFCLAVLVVATVPGYCQYFQFSQYNYTPQRVNPALVSSSNYFLISFDFRNQKTGGDFSLTSNIFNLSYPIINRKGQRWSGVGISFMDDRSGLAGIYNTQEVSFSYAVTIPMVRFHTLSMGLKVLYLNQNVDLTELVTGSQYVEDRGFDSSLDNHEPAGLWRENTITFSPGLYWQNTDKRGNKISYAGFSFFDINKADFLKNAGGLSSSFVFMAGQRVYKKKNVTLFPEILYTANASNHLFNAGMITSYELKSFSRELPERVDFITKYVWKKYAILGMQLHRRNFSVGLSYDFPVHSDNVSNLGTIEIGLEWKRLVSPLRSKKPKRKSEPVNKTIPAPGTVVSDTTEAEQINKVEDLPVNQQAENLTLSEKLRARQDSVLATADAGMITHEPFVLDKAILHFNFEFNSTGIGNDATAYLDQLAEALHDNPDLNIRIVGHTDNVGSDKFNLKLSVARARSVYQYLVDRGVEPDRIAVDGKGMREPLNENRTEQERADNRRVELTILYEE